MAPDRPIPPTFPSDFLVGAATAAHQIEGGNVNADLWDAERTPGTVFVEPSGDACDSYHRYGEDIELLAGAGLDAYRFGVEWARIEPEEGFFSRAALDHYRRVVATCLEHDVTPVVTYQHFTAPKWFARRGGWRDAAAPDLFARYAERVTAHLGDLVPWVCTINEANLMAMLAEVGFAPVGGDEAPTSLPETTDRTTPPPPIGGFPTPDLERMAAAHRMAVEAIKSGPGDIRVGWTLALVDYQPGEGGEERCRRARQTTQLDWLDVASDDDFVGVQTYTRNVIGPDGIQAVPDGTPTMQTGWEVYPDALEHTVRMAADRSGRPVLVTENGMATDDDEARIAYLAQALDGVRRCLGDGVDVRGYLCWTLLDNYEWMAGFSKTFGLIAVDRGTFARTPKPSLRWLGDIARARR